MYLLFRFNIKPFKNKFIKICFVGCAFEFFAHGHAQQIIRNLGDVARKIVHTGSRFFKLMYFFSNLTYT